MVGRAVFTIVRSMTVMNAATASSENARQRWSGGDVTDVT
jgi:hypothetical protein